MQAQLYGFFDEFAVAEYLHSHFAMKIRAHIMTISVLAGSVAIGGCNAADAPAHGNALATPSTAASTPDNGGAPAATAGRAEIAARPGAAPIAAAPAPVWREVTIPAGTSLPIVLDTGVSSATSRVEEPVSAHLTRAIMIDGVAAVPEGSRVSGVVTDATRAAKVKGLAHVAMRFDSLTPRGDDQRYDIRTTSVGRTAPATKKNDALKIGAPAAGGAVIGALVGGKKGALIGTAVGGGAGTGVVLSTRGKEVGLAKGAALTLRLTEPLTIRVRG
jgi:hypothetical protein